MKNIDLEALKNSVNLCDLAGQFTTLAGRGKELKGPCPRCGGKDRFYVQREFFACRKCHPRRGNAIDFACWLRGCDFMEAVTWLSNGNPPTLAEPPAPRPPRPRWPPLQPPPQIWQHRAAECVTYAQAQLWQPAGRPGLDYLLSRGLTEATIWAAGLGYNPKDVTDQAARWGVTDRPTVWLPAGVVIPWYVDNGLHRLNIRLLKPRRDRTGNELKYIGPPGWAGANPLYNADSITPHKPVILVEGEFCALVITQEAGELVTAAATGSKDSAQGGRWIARLTAAPQVLVALDAEPGKGDEAARRWLELLPNAKRWRPMLKDPGDMHRAGLSVRGWVEAALQPAPAGQVDPAVAALVQQWPPECWPVTLYVNNGATPVVFNTPAELKAAT